jgi:RNA polymerase sigma-32 factor
MRPAARFPYGENSDRAWRSPRRRAATSSEPSVGPRTGDDPERREFTRERFLTLGGARHRLLLLSRRERCLPARASRDVEKSVSKVRERNARKRPPPKAKEQDETAPESAREEEREPDEDQAAEGMAEFAGGDEAAPVEVLTEDGFDAPPVSEDSGRALTRLDALQTYMREVQRHPLLSPDEEHALAVKYSQTGDVAAAARLVTANLRLVVKLAYEYRRAYKNMMDLVQEGNIGLMQAVKRYDPYRGVKLSSYAAWWIRAYMLRFILNNWRLVKIGTTQAQRKLFFNLNKEKARLSAMGIEPTHAEIAKRLNVEESEVTEMDRRLARSDASLDAPVGDSDDRTTTRLELLPAHDASPDRLAESAELSHILRARLEEFRKTLAGKDVVIFDKRLTADEPLTLQELGDEFGVSRERVRQLEARLTGKLREYLRESLGDAVGVG